MDHGLPISLHTPGGHVHVAAVVVAHEVAVVRGADVGAPTQTAVYASLGQAAVGIVELDAAKGKR